MSRKILVIFILIFSLTGCASNSTEWYNNYGIPDRTSLSKKESIPKLIKALDDDLPEVRANAAERLGLFGPDAEDATNKLYDLRINDKSGSVRLFAHYALKEISVGDYDGLYLRPNN